MHTTMLKWLYNCSLRNLLQFLSFSMKNLIRSLLTKARFFQITITNIHTLALLNLRSAKLELRNFRLKRKSILLFLTLLLSLLCDLLLNIPFPILLPLEERIMIDIVICIIIYLWLESTTFDLFLLFLFRD